MKVKRDGNRLGLFYRLASMLTEEDLLCIAAADYGMDKGQHLAELQNMIASGSPEAASSWHPGEVLELSRWKEGDVLLTPHELNSLHRQRAFSCVALLAADEKGDLPSSNRSTLIQLVESLDVLMLAGADAADFLLWMLSPHRPLESEDRLFLCLALLHVALPLQERTLHDLRAVVDLTLRCDQSLSAATMADYGSGSKLLRDRDKHDVKWHCLCEGLALRVPKQLRRELLDDVSLLKLFM